MTNEPNLINVQPGTQVLIAAPANPMAPDLAGAIGAAAGSVRGVLEAHLPLCFIPGVTHEAAQVLVLVLARGAFAGAITTELGPRLHSILPPGFTLSVWPMFEDDELVGAVQATGCGIFTAPERLH